MWTCLNSNQIVPNINEDRQSLTTQKSKTVRPKCLSLRLFLGQAEKFRLLWSSLPWHSQDTFWIRGWTQLPSPLGTEFPRRSCNPFATSRALWVHTQSANNQSLLDVRQYWVPSIVFCEKYRFPAKFHIAPTLLAQAHPSSPKISMSQQKRVKSL